MNQASREEVETLKEQWLKDPIFDLPNIIFEDERFAPYKEELELFDKYHNRTKGLIPEKMQIAAVQFSIMFLTNAISDLEKSLSLIVDDSIKEKLQKGIDQYSLQLTEFEIEEKQMKHKMKWGQ